MGTDCIQSHKLSHGLALEEETGTFSERNCLSQLPTHPYPHCGHHKRGFFLSLIVLKQTGGGEV